MRKLEIIFSVLSSLVLSAFVFSETRNVVFAIAVFIALFLLQMLMDFFQNKKFDKVEKKLQNLNDTVSVRKNDNMEIIRLLVNYINMHPDQRFG